MLSSAAFIVCAGFFLLTSIADLSCATPIRWRPGQSAYDGWEKQDDRLGAVASESSICSGYGVDMLKMGGNAADAVSSLAN